VLEFRVRTCDIIEMTGLPPGVLRPPLLGLAVRRSVLLQARRAYDHRLRDEVCRKGTLVQHILNIRRSTAAKCRSRGPRPVVTLEEFDQDRQQLLDTIEKLRRRARVLAAVGRLLFTLLRISGFRFSGSGFLQVTTKLACCARSPAPSRYFLSW